MHPLLLLALAEAAQQDALRRAMEHRMARAALKASTEYERERFVEFDAEQVLLSSPLDRDPGIQNDATGRATEARRSAPA